MNEKKLKEILNKIYIEELVGKNIFQHIHEYEELNELCNKLFELILKYETKRLNKNNDLELRFQVRNLMLQVDEMGRDIPHYKRSLIFFNENGMFTDLF